MTTSAELQEQANQAARIAADLARQARDARRAELEANRPKMPEIGDDFAAVVYFTKYQSGREYQYAAIGWCEGRSVRWTVTGSTTDRFNWPGLLAFIGEANWPSLARFTAAENIGPKPGEEPPVAERMGGFGRVVRTRGEFDETGGPY